jgi:DNA-binding CsgD family transcriptional regulator
MASAAGDPARALAHFDAALAALAGQTDAIELTTRLHLARATAHQAIGRRDDALADARAALAVAAPLGDPTLLARVHRALLLLHIWTGPADEARAHGARAVALAASSGERTVEWSAHWAMAVHGGLTGDAVATAHHLREAERLADEVRSPVLRLWTADVAIEYHSGIGEWPTALALAAQAIPAARALGQRTLLPRLLVWTGLVHRGVGDLEQARVLIEEAWSLTGAGVDGGADAADVHAVVPAYTGMAGYLMTAGENARALEVGEAGLAIADRAGYVAWAIYRLIPFVIETALYLEDYDRAARYNARLRRDSAALGHALGLAWADTTDALLAYLGGDAARAVPMLRAATGALEQVPFVFDAARLRRLVARALLDAGDETGAASELRKAHETFARLGAERELRAAREQLRAIGARVPAARPAPGRAGALSAREAEIARLVAARRSNKEIGVALDISARTVSTHLSNIFQKLGVTSRGELADRVREEGI